MTNLSKVKYCIEFDEGIEISDNKEGKYKIIDNKYIIDVKYDKIGDKEQFVVYSEDFDYATNKLYWWQKRLINYVLSKGFKKVIFKISYINLDIEIVKEFDSPIDYPQDVIMAGVYFKGCIKRKNCSELNNAIIGDNAVGELKNDAQLMNTLNMIQNKKKLIESIEDQLKEKLYKRIEENNNCLKLEQMGIELSRKDIDKDIIKYSIAKEIDGDKLLNDDTVTIKITKIKEILKKDKILASKIKFERAPFKKELQIDNIKKV
jgi:hypothetical protein